MSRQTKLAFKVLEESESTTISTADEPNDGMVIQSGSGHHENAGENAGDSESSCIIAGCESILDNLVCHARALTDAEKYELLTTPQTDLRDAELDTRYFDMKGSRKRKQITFQRKWLKDYNWLRYCSRESHRGGWCLICCLFLSGTEKDHLGAFVNVPFVNYNKSNEVCKKHGSRDYHLSAADRALAFKSSYTNPQSRIDSVIIDVGAKNFKINSEILPLIVESVLTCSRQRIALQGHNQDTVLLLLMRGIS